MTTVLKLLKVHMQDSKRNRNFTEAVQLSLATPKAIANYMIAENNYNDYINKQK